MKTKLFSFMLIAACVVGFYACSNDDEEVRQTNVTLSITEPNDLPDIVMSAWNVTLTEKNTGRTYNLTGNGKTLNLLVDEGDYKIEAAGKVSYTLDGKTVNGELRISSISSVVVGEMQTITLSPFLYVDYDVTKGGFLIEEIFFTGTATPEGKAYSGDKFIKLYNNTDKTLYADGVFVGITMMNTAITYTYIPDIVDEYVPVGSLFIIPGDGTKYPVEPGKSFLLTQSAVNHKLGNANSFDLTNANMEWVNEGYPNQPADNPNVPNAKSLYGNFALHHAGTSCVIIGRLEETQEKYLADYIYDYSWKGIINGNEYTRGPFQDYKIPNSWVMDGVYTSVDGKALRRVFSPTIDMDWTYCGASFGDPLRYGKSVRRKVLSTAPDGRKILKDTNNSRVDFTPNATPSLAE